MVSNVRIGFGDFLPFLIAYTRSVQDVAQSFSLAKWERTIFVIKSFKNHLGHAPIYVVPCCCAI